jgi:hypothetical protein
MTTMALEDVLAKVGLRVSAGQFLTLVEDAARRLSPPNPDPGHYFSADQQVALNDVGLNLSPAANDEVDGRARTIAAQAVLRDSALTVTDAATTLSVDTSRVRHRLAAGRLAGWKDRGGWRLPAWQFTSGGVLPGLERVLAALPGDQPPLVIAAFMTTPQEDLRLAGEPATPRQWLLAGGDPTPVVELGSVLGTPV